MRRRVGVLCVMGCAWAVAGASAVRAEDAKPSSPAAPAQPAAPKPTMPAPATPPQGKVVHTFETQEKMEEFARLWQQRQGILMRMSVLNAYWTEEQAALAQLTEQLSMTYQVDASKAYSINTDNRTLIERPAPPQPKSPAATPAAPKAQPAPAAPSEPSKP